MVNPGDPTGAHHPSDLSAGFARPSRGAGESYTARLLGGPWDGDSLSRLFEEDGSPTLVLRMRQSNGSPLVYVLEEHAGRFCTYRHQHES